MAQGYVPDRRGTAAFARGREVQSVTLAAARAGARFMEATAPRRTGQFAGGFEVEAAAVQVGGERRAGAVIRNTAPHAPFAEARARVMRQGLDFIEQTYRSSGGRG